MNDKIFKVGKTILLFLLIIYVGSLISWIFKPISVTFQTVFIPLILSGFLFYLLRPLVQISNKRFSKEVSISLVFLLFILILVLFFSLISPVLQKQVVSLAKNVPIIINEVHDWLLTIDIFSSIRSLENREIFNIEQYVETLSETLNNMGRGIISGIGSVVGTVTNAIFAIILIPMLLFYSLKDAEKFKEGFLNLFKEKQQYEVRQILKEIDDTLSYYIQGQGIVCLFVGILCFIAFLIIGLEYALLLAIIAGITNIIPYFGPWIGTIPAVVVALFISPFTAFITVISIIIIQSIESNLIRPQVIGRKLKIHPITIIFLILIAGRLWGFLGMIIIIPIYAVLRILLTYGIKLWKIKKEEI